MIIKKNFFIIKSSINNKYDILKLNIQSQIILLYDIILFYVNIR